MGLVITATIGLFKEEPDTVDLSAIDMVNAVLAGSRSFAGRLEILIRGDSLDGQSPRWQVSRWELWLSFEVD